MSIEATKLVLLKQTYTPHSRRMLTSKKKKKNQIRKGHTQTNRKTDLKPEKPLRLLDSLTNDGTATCWNFDAREWGPIATPELNILISKFYQPQPCTTRSETTGCTNARECEFCLRIGIGVDWQNSRRYQTWGKRASNRHFCTYNPLHHLMLKSLEYMKHAVRERRFPINKLHMEAHSKESYGSTILMLTFEFRILMPRKCLAS